MFSSSAVAVNVTSKETYGSEQVGKRVYFHYYTKRNVVMRYCDMCVLTHNLKYYLQLAN